MPTKFYLHAQATTDTGTLPGPTVSISATTPTKIADGANKSMDATIGVSQTSTALTTNAVSTGQPSLICRFLSAPIAAQTFANQSVSLHVGGSESSTSSFFHASFVIGVWRPGTGSSIGLLTDLGASISVTSTTEAAFNGAQGSTTSQTSQDGDVLVFEVWRDTNVQSMSTAYSNTVFYDGTTEDSATTNAAYVLFTNNVTMSTAAAQVPYRNPYPPLIVQ